MAFGREWVAQRGIRIGIHVRRTDQLTEAHGGSDPGVEYFERALAMLPFPHQAVVCTDDVAWVRSHRVFDNMHLRDSSDPAHEDMAILAACHHMIMSIGTFGWWAAYLRATEGQTIYYATPFKRPMNYQDHFPAHWTPLS